MTLQEFQALKPGDVLTPLRAKGLPDCVVLRLTVSGRLMVRQEQTGTEFEVPPGRCKQFQQRLEQVPLPWAPGHDPRFGR